MQNFIDGSLGINNKVCDKSFIITKKLSRKNVDYSLQSNSPKKITYKLVLSYPKRYLQRI